MNDELFNELVESVRQGGAILRGEEKPARSFQDALPKNEDFESVWASAIAREWTSELSDEREDIYSLADGNR